MNQFFQARFSVCVLYVYVVHSLVAWCSREDEFPPKPLKKCAKTATKINAQEILLIDG